MKTLLPFLFYFALTSCDVPTRSRTYTSTSSSDSSTSGTSTDVTTGSEEDEDSTTSDDVTNTTGFASCSLSYSYYNSNIGYFGLCQSSVDEKVFKLKMAQSDSSTGTCLVPIYIDSSSNSYKVGNSECVNNVAGQVYNVTFTKTTSTYAINGVMALKANALTAYEQCMSARDTYINYYGSSCYYSSSCLTAANNYANSICSSFVSSYSNYYVQVQL